MLLLDFGVIDLSESNNVQMLLIIDRLILIYVVIISVYITRDLSIFDLENNIEEHFVYIRKSVNSALEYCPNGHSNPTIESVYCVLRILDNLSNYLTLIDNKDNIKYQGVLFHIGEIKALCKEINVDISESGYDGILFEKVCKKLITIKEVVK